MKKVKASIYCLTYNHVAYIRETLDGFMMQKTDFDFNVLIIDDASTDGTSDIVREYQKKYPDVIYAYISPVNTHGKAGRGKMIRTLQNQYLTGEYIAWCEGDDAWTCEDKLQMQVDFLEKNPGCMMTTHAFRWIDYQNNEETSVHLFDKSCYLRPEDVISPPPPSGFIATASMVMRRNIFLREDGFPQCDIGDHPTQLYAICRGDVYYFDKEMSLYRYRHKGSWTRDQSENLERYVSHALSYTDFLMRYNIYAKKRFEKPVWKATALDLSVLVEKLCEMNEAKRFIKNVSERRGHLYDYLIEGILPVYDWMSGNYQMDNQTKEMVTRYEHICVMGKGKYSKFIVDGLEKSEISYDGYLLSKKDEDCEEPNVWDVLDFPYNKETALVIVGISQAHEDAITETLEKHGFKNVWCPLWFDKERIWGQGAEKQTC